MQNAAAAAAQDLNEFISFFCARDFFVPNRGAGAAAARNLLPTFSNARISIACVKNLVINACRFLMKNSYLVL